MNIESTLRRTVHQLIVHSLPRELINSARRRFINSARRRFINSARRWIHKHPVRSMRRLSHSILGVANCRFSTAVEQSSSHGKSIRVPNLIGGSFVYSHSSDTIDVINLATQEVVSQVPLTTKEEFKSAVSAAKEVFPSWRNTPITTRQRIMLKLQDLIRKNMTDKASMLDEIIDYVKFLRLQVKYGARH